MLLALLALPLAWGRFDARTDRQNVPLATQLGAPRSSSLSDNQLQAAADGLLAAVSPRLQENSHFPAFARAKLEWMEEQARQGRLTVAFLFDPESMRLPRSVLMSASHLHGQPTIFIVKPQFESFLHEAGRVTAPFTPQQKNDFAIGLVHEISHLQNTTGNPQNPGAFFREESRAWREVSIQVIRPLRERNQPMHREFIDADDALRLCHDELPCPALSQLVRLTP